MREMSDLSDLRDLRDMRDLSDLKRMRRVNSNQFYPLPRGRIGLFAQTLSATAQGKLRRRGKFN
jgi:hypothetical protein